MAGPTISAVCMNEVEVAMARCSMAGPTMPGSSDAMVGRSNACAAPSTATAIRMRAGVICPCHSIRIRARTVAASTHWQISPMRLRS